MERNQAIYFKNPTRAVVQVPSLHPPNSPAFTSKLKIGKLLSEDLELYACSSMVVTSPE